MSPSGTRNSAFHHFSAVPHRAFTDKRLKARHHRVLGAICAAADRETAYALISQARISKRASISRQYIKEITADLEAWGYVRRIERGRTRGRRFTCLMYAVLYDEPPPLHDTSEGDMDRVTSGGGISVSPPERAESDPFTTDIQTLPDLQDLGVCNSNSGTTARTSAARQNDRVVGMQEGDHAIRKPIKRPPNPVKEHLSDSNGRLQMAKDKAEVFERSQRNAAEQRICEGLFKAFPGDNSATALEALEKKVHEAAVDAELRKRGAGVAIVVTAVTTAMARTFDKVAAPKECLRKPGPGRTKEK